MERQVLGLGPVLGLRCSLCGAVGKLSLTHHVGQSGREGPVSSQSTEGSASRTGFPEVLRSLPPGARPPEASFPP